MYIHYYAVIIKNPKTKTMKKIALLSLLFLIVAWNVALAQINNQSNPIPSFNYPLNSTTAVFQEQPGNETFEKRDANVVITSTSDATEDQFAVVTFTNSGNSEVLGPYTIYLNQEFKVTLGKGRWSATVSTPSSLKVSIWLEKEK